MGRPKGSKNNTTAAKSPGRPPKEKLNFTLVNRFLQSAADWMADMSLVNREHAQMIQLEREQQIQREKDLKEFTEKFIKDHGVEIAQDVQQQLAGEGTNERAIESTTTDTKPADLGEIFGKDPVSK